MSSIYHSFGRQYLRAKRKHVSLWLNNEWTEACADTGSGVNFISKKYAQTIAAKIDFQVYSFPLPIKGSSIFSVGTTSIDCAFDGDTTSQPYQFYVFKRLLHNVTLGREFLRQTETLDVHQNRLYEIDGYAETRVQVCSVDAGGERIYCWLDEKPVWALPDTGAGVNLVSSSFAKRPRKRIDRSRRTTVEFANAYCRKTLGTIDVLLSFCIPARCGGTTKLMESPNSRATLSTVPVQVPVLESFHVLNDLNFDVVLGETLLASFDAYVQLKNRFTSVAPREGLLPCIGPIRETRKGEGTKKGRSKRQDEKQKMDADYQKEQSRNEGARNGIADASYSQEQDRTNDKWAAHQTHLQWWTTNRDRSERHYGTEYYAQNRPQRSGW